MISDASSPVLQLDGVTIRHGHFTAVEDISLSAATGSVIAILGPSGCGKTTILYALAGLNKNYDGRVSLVGQPPQKGRRDLAIILQHYGLLPWKSVRENVELGLRFRGESNTDEITLLIEQLGLSTHAQRFPNQLSGGQKQRVAIARALSLNPEVLLMDEPFSALDALTREDMQELFVTLRRERRFTTLLVTHSVEEALYLGDQIVVLSSSPGRILGCFKNPSAGNRTHPEHISLAQYIRQLLLASRRGEV